MNFKVEVRPCEEYDQRWKHPHWYWRVDRLDYEGTKYLHDGFATYRWLAVWRAFVTVLENRAWGE